MSPSKLASTVGLFLFAATTIAAAQVTAPPGSGGGALPVPTVDPGIRTGPSAAVIRPGNPDPGITVKPPATGLTPVVPPPSGGGNAPLVIPK